MPDNFRDYRETYVQTLRTAKELLCIEGVTPEQTRTIMVLVQVIYDTNTQIIIHLNHPNMSFDLAMGVMREFETNLRACCDENVSYIEIQSQLAFHQVLRSLPVELPDY